MLLAAPAALAQPITSSIELLMKKRLWSVGGDGKSCVAVGEADRKNLSGWHIDHENSVTHRGVYGLYNPQYSRQLVLIFLKETACYDMLHTMEEEGRPPRAPDAPEDGSWWLVENANATQTRVNDIKATLSKCAGGLDAVLPRPRKLLVLTTYGTRGRFVGDLPKKIGITKQEAERFRTSPAPRAAKGVLLVPPDQTLMSVCNEVAHHAMEQAGSREALRALKWFDEGMAATLARRIISPEQSAPDVDVDAVLDPELMESEAEWRELHASDTKRQAAAVQSRHLSEFFLTVFGERKLADLLAASREEPWNATFKRVTGLSLTSFYDSWNAELFTP